MSGKTETKGKGLARGNPYIRIYLCFSCDINLIARLAKFPFKGGFKAAGIIKFARSKHCESFDNFESIITQHGFLARVVDGAK